MINPVIANLKQALEGKLPGREAQIRMSPTLRPAGQIQFDGSAFKPSGVLILLFPGPEGLSTIFIERSSNGPHGGQVSLPGGKQENGDPDLVHTALREAEEEIGVEGGNLEIIGNLTPLYVPHSNYCIQPVVAWSPVEPQLRINRDEVEEPVIVSLDQLFRTENRKTMTFNHNGTVITAPYYDASGHCVWGATAMIISELEELVTSCIF
ncbi:MAG: CoA pyrophosphatase [Bacteroidales bacterium]